MVCEYRQFGSKEFSLQRLSNLSPSMFLILSCLFFVAGMGNVLVSQEHNKSVKDFAAALQYNGPPINLNPVDCTTALSAACIPTIQGPITGIQNLL